MLFIGIKFLFKNATKHKLSLMHCDKRPTVAWVVKNTA